jgi:hypothetical protein
MHIFFFGDIHGNGCALEASRTGASMAGWTHEKWEKEEEKKAK